MVVVKLSRFLWQILSAKCSYEYLVCFRLFITFFRSKQSLLSAAIILDIPPSKILKKGSLNSGFSPLDVSALTLMRAFLVGNIFVTPKVPRILYFSTSYLTFTLSILGENCGTVISYSTATTLLQCKDTSYTTILSISIVVCALLHLKLKMKFHSEQQSLAPLYWMKYCCCFFVICSLYSQVKCRFPFLREG